MVVAGGGREFFQNKHLRREVVKNNNESGRLVGKANEGCWDQAAGIFFYFSK